MFSQAITLRWADLDPNGHVRHSVYFDWGAMVRVTYLQKHGVGLDWMARNAIGPILFREEARFLREVRFGDELTIDYLIAASSDDGRKWRLRHRIVRAADVVATLELDGAWMDLRARKIVAPPKELVDALATLGRTEDFTVLPGGKPAG
jgi:acyl-CoA thioester hydrolase